jgi:PEP-CTERM motif-containing protein
MKRFLLVPSLLALILMGAASAAHADPLTLVSIGTNTFRGTSAGPYSALLNGSPITMVCLSFDRHVAVGQTWQVAINSLDASGVANALFGAQANALLKYQRAAWLYDQLTARPDQASAIQGAIWNIFKSSTPDSVASIRWFSAAMNANLEGYDFSRFRILTPTDRSAGGPQENMTTVPEPMTMLLLGSGLLGVAAKVRRHRRLTNSEIAEPAED